MKFAFLYFVQCHPDANLFWRLHQRLRATWSVAHTSLVNAGLRRIVSTPVSEEIITAAVERLSCRGPHDNAQKIRNIANGGHQMMFTYGKMWTKAILTTTSRLRMCGLNLRAGVQTARGWTLEVRFLSRPDFSPCYGIQTSTRFHLSF